MQGWETISVLLGILCTVQCRQYTLNVPRVLLPIVPASGVKANFTLKSQAGCFTWWVMELIGTRARSDLFFASTCVHVVGCPIIKWGALLNSGLFSLTLQEEYKT